MPVFKMPRMPVKKAGLAAIVAASITLGAPLTLQQEGVKLTPYYDSVGKLTWCGGETEVGYKPKFTFEECSDLFKMRYGWYSYRTAEFYNDTGKAMLQPQIHAAFTDMSYNIGLNAVKNSSMIRNINAGDALAACNAILKYKYAKGRDCSKEKGLPRGCYGVWTRRLAMHSLCLEGLK